MHTALQIEHCAQFCLRYRTLEFCDVSGRAHYSQDVTILYVLRGPEALPQTPIASCHFDLITLVISRAGCWNRNRRRNQPPLWTY
jgi:hypothetical protein